MQVIGVLGSRTTSTCCVSAGIVVGEAVAVEVGTADRVTAEVGVAVGRLPGVNVDPDGVAVGADGAEVGVGGTARVGDGVGELSSGVCVSPAGQMVSDSCCTQRCSAKAVWIAAFSGFAGRTSKPLEPLPPLHAVNTDPDSRNIHHRYRHICMVASFKKESTSPAR
jgi:hypothetical protein